MENQHKNPNGYDYSIYDEAYPIMKCYDKFSNHILVGMAVMILVQACCHYLGAI